MLETYIRKPYQQALVNPIAKMLNKKVSPNQLTLLSGVIGVLVLPCLYFGAYILAIILLLASGYLDTLDGTLARLTNQSSDWGSVLDITVDRIVEFVVILSLWLVAPEMRSFWVIMMLGSILLCITSFLVVGIFNEFIASLIIYSLSIGPNAARPSPPLEKEVLPEPLN